MNTWRAEVRESESRWPWRRPQRWYVVILGGSDVLFTSELYTNRGYAQALADRVEARLG